MAQAKTQPHADPVALAVEIRPLLERNAVRVERDRRLPIENVEALQAADLFKVMTPRRWGGYGTTLSTSLKTFAELAKGCPSTGWVTMIIAGINWWASLLPDRGQEEIFANSADPRVCGATGSPTVVGRRADGGLRISGKFPFASGCWHSTWGGSGFRSKMMCKTSAARWLGLYPSRSLKSRTPGLSRACAALAPIHWSRRTFLFPII
jgi:alkylation response protein AidB-like acyl-CoA dehydrogenase